MRRSDVFVYYDDVQFDKHGWRNRNRIKTLEGPKWLTVPVRHSGLGWPLIKDVMIDGNAWVRKHTGTLRQYYKDAPFADRYLPEFETLLREPRERLVDLDVATTAQLGKWLGIERPIVKTSELNIGGERSERLLNFCLHFGATTYLSGSAARDYLDVELFRSRGVNVVWQDYAHPTYPQLHGEFVPFLSVIDLLLNCGEDSARLLAGTSEGDA